MPTNITQTGSFIDVTTAKANLNAYLNDTGVPQPAPDDPNHVFGHVLGLVKIKELMEQIDLHNLMEEDISKHVHGLRVYYSKTKGVRDILVVPVTSDGNDYPIPVYGAAAAISKAAVGTESPLGQQSILTDSRPCPNLCN